MRVLNETVTETLRNDDGVTGLRVSTCVVLSADPLVDCSGFASALLGKAKGEPFIDFGSSLFCDRAVVGGWERGAGEPIEPFTTCETMDAGWCWQIEHERRIDRGYVYSSAFVSDEVAERDSRERNPKVGPTRVVRFTSGRYRAVGWQRRRDRQRQRVCRAPGGDGAGRGSRSPTLTRMTRPHRRARPGGPSAGRTRKRPRGR